MKAIDLYSGIGGWALGFKLAGIKMVASYEIWDQAIETSNINLGEKNKKTDIRTLKIKEIPSNVDIVVGSPPCTQFSYSNRGGSGDIDEGLKDIEKFLEVVKAVSPKYWAMENIPRVKNILEKEIAKGGSLYKYRKLFSVISIIDMSEFSLPQKRKRLIVTKPRYLVHF